MTDEQIARTRKDLDDLPVDSILTPVERQKFGRPIAFRKVNSTNFTCDGFYGFSGPVPLPARVIWNPRNTA